MRMTPEAVKAFEGCKVKAAQGDADAQCYLGKCYSFSEGVAMNPVKAVKWYRKAADQGHAEAQFRLGDCYRYRGVAVEQDYVQAVTWWRKAAEQGDANALNYLAKCYYNGIGVAQDVIEAYALWELMPGEEEEGKYDNLRMSAKQIAAGKKRAIELQKELDPKREAGREAHRAKLRKRMGLPD